MAGLGLHRQSSTGSVVTATCATTPLSQSTIKQKPKLDIARRLRGIYFVDPEDGECKETIKNARRKLEVPMDAAMLCKNFCFQ